MRQLLTLLPKKSGRDVKGHVSVRHQGGRAKRFLREIDFKRDKKEVLGVVELIEYDPNRNASIAKIIYEDGERRGKEYPTAVGPIDILTVDENGDFYIFETKLSKGMDRALGQLLRYMGWIKVNLAKDKNVYGIIVANKMDEKIKYAVEVTPNVSLCEYEMKFDINFLNKM